MQSCNCLHMLKSTSNWSLSGNLIRWKLVCMIQVSQRWKFVLSVYLEFFTLENFISWWWYFYYKAFSYVKISSFLIFHCFKRSVFIDNLIGCSKERQGHINYRDSKLTRMLQPCLGGNARTAVICTLSTARSHVEQTRNTLLFACCAKEVTTKAQVNVVMSDKALVKHLQKEVARLESELKTPVHAASNCDYAALLRKKDLQIEKVLILCWTWATLSVSQFI